MRNFATGAAENLTSKEERIVVEAPVACTVIANEKSWVCAALNISSGGIFLKTDVTLPIGCRVRCEFDFTGHRYSLCGKVVWSRFVSGGDIFPCGLGINWDRQQAPYLRWRDRLSRGA